MRTELNWDFLFGYLLGALVTWNVWIRGRKSAQINEITKGSKE